MHYCFSRVASCLRARRDLPPRVASERVPLRGSGGACACARRPSRAGTLMPSINDHDVGEDEGTNAGVPNARPWASDREGGLEVLAVGLHTQAEVEEAVAAAVEEADARAHTQQQRAIDAAAATMRHELQAQADELEAEHGQRLHVAVRNLAQATSAALAADGATEGGKAQGAHAGGSARAHAAAAKCDDAAVQALALASAQWSTEKAALLRRSVEAEMRRAEAERSIQDCARALGETEARAREWWTRAAQLVKRAAAPHAVVGERSDAGDAGAGAASEDAPAHAEAGVPTAGAGAMAADAAAFRAMRTEMRGAAAAAAAVAATAAAAMAAVSAVASTSTSVGTDSSGASAPLAGATAGDKVRTAATMGDGAVDGGRAIEGGAIEGSAVAVGAAAALSTDAEGNGSGAPRTTEPDAPNTPPPTAGAPPPAAPTPPAAPPSGAARIPVGVLRKALAARGVDSSVCVERAELVALLESSTPLHPPSADPALSYLAAQHAAAPGAADDGPANTGLHAAHENEALARLADARASLGRARERVVPRLAEVGLQQQHSLRALQSATLAISAAHPALQASLFDAIALLEAACTEFVDTQTEIAQALDTAALEMAPPPPPGAGTSRAHESKHAPCATQGGQAGAGDTSAREDGAAARGEETTEPAPPPGVAALAGVAPTPADALAGVVRTTDEDDDDAHEL